MTPKWIFFDLDDTLFDFSRASLSCLRRLWEEEAQIREVFTSPDAFIEEYHIHNSRMWKLHESGLISADFLKPERFRLTVVPARNDEEAIILSRKLNDRYLWLLGECDTPCKGAKETLEILSRNFLIGVLTNGFTEVQYRKLHSTGLDRYVQRMVISDEIEIQKPDPAIFRYAEEATGATPESAIMVGDNPDNDVVGALNAGWKSIYYDCRGKALNIDAPRLIGRISDLRDIPSLLGISHIKRES